MRDQRPAVGDQCEIKRTSISLRAPEKRDLQPRRLDDGATLANNGSQENRESAGLDSASLRSLCDFFSWPQSMQRSSLCIRRRCACSPSRSETQLCVWLCFRLFAFSPFRLFRFWLWLELRCGCGFLALARASGFGFGSQPLTYRAVKRAEHRRATGPASSPCLSAASLGCVPRRPRSAGDRCGFTASDRVRRRRFCLLLARQK